MANEQWDWSGAYVGAHFGGGLGKGEIDNPFGPSIFGNTVRDPFLLGGGHLGYNWQPSNSIWVIGIQGDLSGLSSDGTNTCDAFVWSYISQNCRVQPQIIASITPRVGVIFDPSRHTLFYLKAGPAWMHSFATINDNGIKPIENVTSSQKTYSVWGEMVGIGIERALSPAWTVAIDYGFLHFNSPKIDIPISVELDTEKSFSTIEGARTNINHSFQLLSLGINYKIGEDPFASWERSKNDSTSQDRLNNGWQFEVGTRYWFSNGRYQKDLTFSDSVSLQNNLVSRLTYQTSGNANELFGYLESPLHVFTQAYVGVGNNEINGKLNDEDWIVLLPLYTNTLSQVSGAIHYATIDLGYNFLSQSSNKLGILFGYNYYKEDKNAYGCEQIASPFGPCAGESVPNNVLAITENSRWQSMRLGLMSEIDLIPRIKLKSEVAYLPYVQYRGLDIHQLREDVPDKNSQEFGQGTGVQAQSVLSCLVGRGINVGAGARYWAMWTTHQAFTEIFGQSCPCPVLPSKTERYGGFLQLSYQY